MRIIIFDTETTGFEPSKNHRIVEIGCIEVDNRKKTGNILHHYFDPQRDMPEDAFKVHGISKEMLIGKPLFSDIAKEIYEFFKDSIIVAHNASFDIKFVNHELKLANYPPLSPITIIDTLSLARKKFPGSPATLDALCRRFNINLSKREKHGALLDAELLFDVYIELTGGNQNSMVFDIKAPIEIPKYNVKTIKKVRNISVTDEEKINHEQFMKKIKNPVWGS